MGDPPHTFEHKPDTKLGKISRSHRKKRPPLKLKTENILPRGAPSKRLRYGGQNKTLVSFRLLLFVMLHGGKILKNEEFRKDFSNQCRRFEAAGSNFKCYDETFFSMVKQSVICSSVPFQILHMARPSLASLSFKIQKQESARVFCH